MSCKIGTKCFLAKDTVNEEDKSVEVILSDETQVVRYSWEEGEYFLTLSHEESAVNLERAEILSLFINHDTYALPIGKFSNVRLEDRKLKATATFDEDDIESMKIFNKLRKGFLQSFSVGVEINTKILEKEEKGVKHYKATQWSINEASVVGIPAIPSAKVGLNQKVATDALAPSVKTANLNTGVAMKFNRENLEETEVQFNALVLNRDTLTNRNESLKLELETKTVALEALQANMDTLKVEMEAEVTGAKAELVSFKAETTTRLQEAVALGMSVDVALAMVQAKTKEEASALTIDANASDGGTNQAEIDAKSQELAFDQRCAKLGITVMKR